MTATLPKNSRPFGLRLVNLLLGEDAARFFTVLPVVKKIDGRLDRISPDSWPEVEARLGDEPCAFLKNTLTDEELAQFKASFEKLGETRPEDVWQVANMLAYSLSEIRDAAREVRAQENSEPSGYEARSFSARRELVAAHSASAFLP